MILAISTVGSLPTASAMYAGDLVRLIADSEGAVFVCLKDAGGTYQWSKWAAGGGD